MQNLLQQLKNTNSSLSTAQVEGLLYLLITKAGLTNNALIQLTGLPKETLRAFKNSISFMLIEQVKENILVKLEFSDELKKLNLQPYRWSLLNYETDPRAAKLAQQITDIRKKYFGELGSKREFDQFYATSLTTASKVLVLQDKGLLSGNIAVLGDDDLVSVAISLFATSVKSVTVFELDERLCSAIERLSGDLGIKNVRVERYDARTAVNNIYSHTFDVVVTDPPYTKSGVRLFLSRCIELAKTVKSSDETASYIYLYYGNSFKSPEKTLKIQEIVNRYNLLVEDKIDNFAHYTGAESIGSSSSLYILKVTPYSNSFDASTLDTHIYTFENQKEEKFPFVDHWVFKVFNVPAEVLKSKTMLNAVFGKFCNLHKLKVVDQKVTSFKKQGFTITYILASSNLLIHTWPEYNALHIDLITCSPIYSKETMVKSLSELLKTKSIEASNIE